MLRLFLVNEEATIIKNNQAKVKRTHTETHTHTCKSLRNVNNVVYEMEMYIRVCECLDIQ